MQYFLRSCLTVSKLYLKKVWLVLFNAIKIFEENDPNCERSSKVALDLRKAYSCYQEIYREKKKKCTKQLTLENFIKKTVHNTADKNLSLPLKK